MVNDTKLVGVSIGFVCTSKGHPKASKQVMPGLLQGQSYLSSSPPSLRTIFRNENTVPKTSFESSSVDRTVWPRPVGAAPETVSDRDFPTMEAGRGSQRRL